jgi:hypothetical protein
MKQIPLITGGFAIVDDEDFEELIKYKWSRVKGPNTDYARQSGGQKMMMHRYLLKPETNMQVDHINHNGLDNRRDNIRVCTRSENMKNVRPYGTSKYLGVNLHKAKRLYIKKDGTEKTYVSKRWRASITVDGKTKHLGLFEKEIDAAKRYDEEAAKTHGEFANLNFKK